MRFCFVEVLIVRETAVRFGEGQVVVVVVVMVMVMFVTGRVVGKSLFGEEVLMYLRQQKCNPAGQPLQFSGLGQLHVFE